MRRRGAAAIALSPLLVAFVSVTVLRAENIDPAENGSRYAWSENAGWLNCDPDDATRPGVQVDDFELTGWMWGENLGWVSLSCKNTGSCDTVGYGVRNDGRGVLAGQAWSETAGWIDFGPFAGSPEIDAGTGDFRGHAWSENLGWISFRSDGPSPFRVVTAWRCDPAPAPPEELPVLTVRREKDEVVLSWSAPREATGYDVVEGDLLMLREADGDFAAAETRCLADDRTSLELRGTIDSFEWAFYLVRAVNCGGAGSYASGGADYRNRDETILESPEACP